jgi:hypothetical protein
MDYYSSSAGKCVFAGVLPLQSLARIPPGDSGESNSAARRLWALRHNCRRAVVMAGFGLVLLAVLVPGALAQGALTNGAEHPGTILVGEVDTWTVEVQTGDTLILRAGGVGFTPRIDLYGPGGALVTSSGSSGLATRDATAAHPGAVAGTFTVTVSSFYAGGNGSYTLRLAQVPGAFETSARIECW